MRTTRLCYTPNEKRQHSSANRAPLAAHCEPLTASRSPRAETVSETETVPVTETVSETETVSGC